MVTLSGGDHVGVLGSGPLHFLAVWGPYVLGPPLLPPCSGYEQLWSNVVLLLVVLCNYLDHHLVWYNSTSRQLTCPVNLSLAGLKLPFPGTRICAPTAVGPAAVPRLPVYTPVAAAAAHSHSHLAVSISIRQ